MRSPCQSPSGELARSARSTIGRDGVRHGMILVMRSGSSQQALETLGALLRGHRLAKGLSLRELAARTSVSNAYLSELERGRHEPSLSVLRALASALDTPLGAMLMRAGVLDDGERNDPRGDTEAAIERDPALSEPQRIALLSVYRSFVPGRR
jgi:transcriptional regulator with XRE-family HTH domain